MIVDRLSARGSTEVGRRQSHGCLEGKRENFPLAAIALSELDANAALCEVDAAQLRQGNPRSAQMLPTFPSIKPSGGYHDGCGVERIRIEISRPSASKSKAASSRELMFAQASFCASSVRYDAVSTRHPRAQPMKA